MWNKFVTRLVLTRINQFSFKKKIFCQLFPLVLSCCDSKYLVNKHPKNLMFKLIINVKLKIPNKNYNIGI